MGKDWACGRLLSGFSHSLDQRIYQKSEQMVQFHLCQGSSHKQVLLQQKCYEPIIIIVITGKLRTKMG